MKNTRIAKKAIIRWFSIMLTVCMLLSCMTVAISEEEHDETEEKKTYIQPVELSADDVQTLTEEEVQHYAEISNELLQQNSDGTVTIQGEDSYTVYSINEDGSTIQEFTYSTDEEAVMSLTSYSEITLMNTDGVEEESTADDMENGMDDGYNSENGSGDFTYQEQNEDNENSEPIDSFELDNNTDLNDPETYEEQIEDSEDYSANTGSIISDEQMVVEEYDNTNEGNETNENEIEEIEEQSTNEIADNRNEEIYSEESIQDNITESSENGVYIEQQNQEVPLIEDRDTETEDSSSTEKVEASEEEAIPTISSEGDDIENQQIVDNNQILEIEKIDNNGEKISVEQHNSVEQTNAINGDTAIDEQDKVVDEEIIEYEKGLFANQPIVEDIPIETSEETNNDLVGDSVVGDQVAATSLMPTDDSTIIKAATNNEFNDEYKNTTQTIITAERLLQMIESGDEFAFSFANKLGFGRTASEIAGNLRSMVTEYHDQINKGNTSFEEPKFVINGVDIVLNRTIEEVSLTKNDDGTYSAVLNGNGDQTGYRTSVMVDADASVTIVYDELSETKIERRVSSGKPTDFVITLDVSGSMAWDGRDKAMKSALKVVLDEILQVKENTVSIVFWSNQGAAMQIKVDDEGIKQVFSGADGMNVTKLMDAALVDRFGEVTGYSLSDATIGQIESLYGFNGGTEPDNGLVKALDLLKNIEKNDGRNVGVMLFTDGEVCTDWFRSDTDSERNTVSLEKQIAEEYGATIVNVSIGDEYNVRNYERYLDPNSDSYYEKDNQVLKDHVIYYNIPKLTDQELADRVSEMFEIAFEDITTEYTELTMKPISEGILAAYASQLIQKIPDGFELVKIRGTDNNVSYQIVGTDENGNAMISYDLDNIISEKDQVISYCVIPTKAENDIGVTAYSDAADTVLHAQPVDRIDVPESNKTVLIHSTRNGKEQERPQRARIDDVPVNREEKKYKAIEVISEKYDNLKSIKSSNDLNSADEKTFVTIEDWSKSKIQEEMKKYHDPDDFYNSELYKIAKHNTKVLQGRINEAKEEGGGTVMMPVGEFYFAPNENSTHNNQTYAIQCESGVNIIGAGQNMTILKPLANYANYVGRNNVSYDDVKKLLYQEVGPNGEKFLQANLDGMDMFYFNNYNDDLYDKLETKLQKIEKENTLSEYQKNIMIENARKDFINDNKDKLFLSNVNFKNFTVDGLESSQYNSGTSYNSAGKGFMINLMEKVSWQNVTVMNTDGSGFGVDSPVDCYITDCVAKRCGKASEHIGPGGSGFGIGIGFQDGESMKISGCVAEDNSKFGFFFEHQKRFTRDPKDPQNPYKYNPYKYAATFSDPNPCYHVEDCTAINNLYNFGGLMAYNVKYDKNCESVYTDYDEEKKDWLIKDWNYFSISSMNDLQLPMSMTELDTLSSIGLLPKKETRKTILDNLINGYGKKSAEIQSSNDIIDTGLDYLNTGIFWGYNDLESHNCDFNGIEQRGKRTIKDGVATKEKWHK